MTEQHECRWEMNSVRGYAYCVYAFCNKKLGGDEIETRLNEYETIEATNAALLEALEYIAEQYPNNRGMNKAREAIRKAREK